MVDVHEWMLPLLAPVLWVQGRRVRRNTPRLPEAAGPRTGVAGQGLPVRLLVLGDSAAAGVGCTTQQEALTGQLVALLAPHVTVHWTLWAQNGRDTADVLALLQAADAQPFDVVVTSLGVNDITNQISPATWRARQAALLQLLVDKFGARQIRVSSVPPMHLFPALPQPLRWYLGQRAQRFNRELQVLLQQHPQAAYAGVEFPMEPAYMAADGYHPGPPACRLWAQEMAQRILATRTA